MRLFVAAEIGTAARADLDRALRPFAADWPHLRWSPPGLWHLTLAFLGEVDERRVDPLTERLARAAVRTGPFALSLRGLGAFSSARRASVVWAGVAGDVEPLRLLAGRVAAAARRSGIDLDAKPYRPHLTVARVRRPPLDVTALVEALAAYRAPSWPVDDIRLVRSHLGAQVRHETLATFAIADSTGDGLYT